MTPNVRRNPRRCPHHRAMTKRAMVIVTLVIRCARNKKRRRYDSENTILSTMAQMVKRWKTDDSLSRIPLRLLWQMGESPI